MFSTTLLATGGEKATGVSVGLLHFPGGKSPALESESTAEIGCRRIPRHSKVLAASAVRLWRHLVRSTTPYWRSPGRSIGQRSNCRGHDRREARNRRDGRNARTRHRPSTSGRVRIPNEQINTATHHPKHPNQNEADSHRRGRRQEWGGARGRRDSRYPLSTRSHARGSPAGSKARPDP